MPPKHSLQESSNAVVRGNDRNVHNNNKNNHPEDDDREDDEIAPFNKFLNTHYSSQFMATLPTRICERTQVLLKYDEEVQKMEKELLLKQVQLRKKYEDAFAPIFKRRFEIVNGTGQPVSEQQICKGFPEQHKGKVNIDLNNDKNEENEKDEEKHENEKEGKHDKDGNSTKGLPGFWLKVLKHHVVLNSMIEEYDEPVLQYLTNISSSLIEDAQPGSLAITFTFAPNPYFTEEKLTLTMRTNDGDTVLERTPISWKSGKDVTVHTITKKQRSKRTGQTRTITHTEDRISFFTIFKKPEKENDDNDGNNKKGKSNQQDRMFKLLNGEGDDEDELISLMQRLHSSIIPCAINYYTGEAPDGTDDIEDNDDEEEEQEEEEEEEEEEPVHMNVRGGNRGRGRRN